MEIDHLNLHHAYLLQGERKEAEKFLSSLFSRLGISETANPDYIAFNAPLFGIDEARLLKEKAQGKAFGKKKIFVIYSRVLTPEAQNALLKTLEEPVADTHFFLLGKKDDFLPTLLSRLSAITLEASSDRDKEGKKFLAASPKDRLDMARKLTSEEGFVLGTFLDSLLLHIREEKRDNAEKDLKNVLSFSKYSRDRGGDGRLILEHLALTLS